MGLQVTTPFKGLQASMVRPPSPASRAFWRSNERWLRAPYVCSCCAKRLGPCALSWESYVQPSAIIQNPS